MSVSEPEDHRVELELRLSLALMVLIWGANYTVAKIALTELDPFTLAACRVILATTFLFLILKLQPRQDPLPDRRSMAQMAFLGLTGVGLNQVLFVHGLHRTVPSHSSLVIATGPIWVLLLAAVFLDEHIGVRKITGVLISFIGVIALTLSADFSIDRSRLAGDLLTLCGVLCFSIYTITSKETIVRYGILRTTAYCHLFGTLMLLPAVFFLRSPNPGIVTYRSILAVTYMGLFASATAYLIFYRGLRDIGAAKIAALS